MYMINDFNITKIRLYFINTQTYIHTENFRIEFQISIDYVCIKRQSNEHQNSCTRSDTTVGYHMEKIYSKRSGKFLIFLQKTTM